MKMSLFFDGSDLEKYSIASLAHQWILCSEWVPSEWVQTADKNIKIIHITPVHSSYFQLKYESSIHNTAFSRENVLSSEICTGQALFTSENSSEQVC